MKTPENLATLFDDCPFREVGKTVMKCVQLDCDGTHHYFVGS